MKRQWAWRHEKVTSTRFLEQSTECFAEHYKADGATLEMWQKRLLDALHVPESLLHEPPRRKKRRPKVIQLQLFGGDR